MRDTIRKADKSIHGDVPKRNQRCRTKRPVDKQAEAEQRERLKGITDRIRAEEQQLRDNKINPFWAGTAEKFDELKSKDAQDGAN